MTSIHTPTRQPIRLAPMLNGALVVLNMILVAVLVEDAMLRLLLG